MKLHGTTEPLKSTINSLMDSTIYLIKNTVSNKAIQSVLSRFGGIVTPEIRLVSNVTADLLVQDPTAPMKPKQSVVTSMAYSAATFATEKMITDASLMAATALVGTAAAPVVAVPLVVGASTVVAKATSQAVNKLFFSQEGQDKSSAHVKRVPVAVTKKAGALRPVRRHH